MKILKLNYVLISALLCTIIQLHAQVNETEQFFEKLKTERVASEKTIVWEQVAPGNAGFANLLRYHPTIPKLVVLCPDMWNIYQSDNNGIQWYNIKDSDGNGDFYHIRDLYYSPSDANFGLAIESSRLWKTNDLGKTWENVTKCPWYSQDENGFDKTGWQKKVASLAIDPNNKNIWFVGGGSNVRGQEWLSCYQDITATQPRGTSADNEGKLWRTTNGGTSWTLVNSGMDPKAQVGRIIVNPMNSQQVFASSNYGIYRSDNGGTTWQQISSGKLDNDIIMDMDFYYNKAKNIFKLYVIDQVQYLPYLTATKCTGGIYKSEDNGNTWKKMNGDLGLDVNRLTGGVSANYYKYIANWLGITESVAKSTYPTLPTSALQCFNMLSVDPSRENALYIGFADPQVANSIVPGRVWTTSNDGQKWINTARLYGDIWAADKDYWISRGNPYNENMKVGHESPHMQSGSNYALRSTRGIAVGVDGSVMMISDHSTMLSTDHGTTWQQMDEDYTVDGNIIGHGNSNLPALTIAQDKRYETAILGSGEHRVWIPTDDSPDERQALKFITSAQETVITMAFDPYDNKTIYGTSSRQAKKQNIFKSSDGGLTWSEHGVATPATNAWGDDFYTNALAIDPIDNKYFYFGITAISNTSKADMGGFYFSNDEGKTFSQRNNGLPSPSRISDIKFDPRDTSRKSLFVAAEKNAFTQVSPVAQGGLYFSSNRGESWTKVTTPSSVEGVNEIVIDNANRMYITTGYRGAGNGVWYTDDFGTNWNQIFKYAGAQGIDVSPFDNNLIVVTVEHLAKNPGVFVSKDRGITWAKSNTNIASPNHIEDIKFNLQKSSEMWIATLGSGFYKGRIENGNEVQAIKVSPKFIEYTASSNKQLTAEIIQTKYKDEIITWRSDNPAVVTVNQNGLITTVGKGNAKVWASTVNGRFADYSVIIIKDTPVSNSAFKIQTIGESCHQKKNGQVLIEATQENSYVAKLQPSNITKDFTKSTAFENLAPGTFEVCVTSPNDVNFKQCYSLTIPEVEALKVSSKTSIDHKMVAFSLDGSQNYTININDKIYNTSNSFIELPLEKGNNNIKITAEKECQGTFLKNINIGNEITIAPNPFSSNLKVSLGSDEAGLAIVKIYSSLGSLVYAEEKSILNNQLNLSTSFLTKGVYILTVHTINTVDSFKIIKK